MILCVGGCVVTCLPRVVSVCVCGGGGMCSCVFCVLENINRVFSWHNYCSFSTG